MFIIAKLLKDSEITELSNLKESRLGGYDQLREQWKGKHVGSGSQFQGGVCPGGQVKRAGAAQVAPEVREQRTANAVGASALFTLYTA